MTGCMVREVTLRRLVIHMGYRLGMGNISEMLLSGNVILGVIVVSQIPVLMLILLGREW